ncbi:hypothetical protein LGK95_00280 [Clostridium algoriphilum]|uniref:hypothetical protein n=1 Tax=Clostridium algoriphilum TaxID=198347 RepID=UPI001CF4C727|nr:hypothetical protein [Clostridium algoriphilum]MCB2291974.1 hypothetical protein [Clostridium algoriphilum]
MKNRLDADYYCNATVSFINNSKVYCREKSLSAVVIFDTSRNEMRLKYGMDTVSTLSFFNKVSLDQVSGRRTNGDIVIDNKGYSNDACTIILKDNNSVDHKITMRVGSEFVKIIK